MHILVRHTRRSADFCDRALFLDPQNAAQVMIAIFSCISRFRLRMQTILMPKIAQSGAEILDLGQIQAPSLDFYPVF